MPTQGRERDNVIFPFSLFNRAEIISKPDNAAVDGHKPVKMQSDKYLFEKGKKKMARMTIAQLREREVVRLAQYHSEEYTENDLQTARKLMNSFYRLCGLAERNLYLANDERWCNRKSTKESEERESRWCKRLSAQFKDFAGLELFYCGYCPLIGIIYRPSGGVSEKITRWFYQ